MFNLYELASDIYDERKARRKHAAALRRERLESAPRPVNGTGATAGKSPRDYMRERVTRQLAQVARQMSQDARRRARLPRDPDHYRGSISHMPDR